MSGRPGTRALLLLSTVWSWLIFGLVCGATRPVVYFEDVAAKDDGCCHAPVDHGCASPNCGLTCASLLTAMVSDADVVLLPAITVRSFLSGDEFASTSQAAPPVPPPKCFA